MSAKGKVTIGINFIPNRPTAEKGRHRCDHKRCKCKSSCQQPFNASRKIGKLLKNLKLKENIHA